jgi:hypothetical protein
MAKIGGKNNKMFYWEEDRRGNRKGFHTMLLCVKPFMEFAIGKISLFYYLFLPSIEEGESSAILLLS